MLFGLAPSSADIGRWPTSSNRKDGFYVVDYDGIDPITSRNGADGDSPAVTERTQSCSSLGWTANAPRNWHRGPQPL
jgi:hypothetical protein